MSLMTFRNQIIRRGDFRDKVSVKNAMCPQRMLYLFSRFEKRIVQVYLNVCVLFGTHPGILAILGNMPCNTSR